MSTNWKKYNLATGSFGVIAFVLTAILFVLFVVNVQSKGLKIAGGVLTALSCVSSLVAFSMDFAERNKHE